MSRTLIAVPSHDYMHAETNRCLMTLDKPEGTSFVQVTNTLIYNARNLIAQKAIEHGFDRVMWFDADMVFEPDTLLKLSADMDQGMDLVTGLYFTRLEPIKPVIHKELHWEVKPNGIVDSGAILYWDYPQDSVFEIACCGFGCVLTSIELLKKMVDKYGTPFYPLMGMGEDTTFCFRAAREGVKMYCDSRVKAGHIGQKIYTEDDYIRQMEDDHEMPL